MGWWNVSYVLSLYFWTLCWFALSLLTLAKLVYLLHQRCMAEYLPNLEDMLGSQVSHVPSISPKKGCLHQNWVSAILCFFPFLQFIPLFLTRSFSLISIPQIRDAILSIEVRRKFIMALASPFGRPVEADPVCILKHLYLRTKKVDGKWSP